MLKNKFKIRKIKNIFILIMIVAIMLGMYNNVRRSRAENVIEISLEVADKNNQIEKETVTVEATETKDGVYQLELPEIVNTKVIAQYYNSGNEEINSKTIQLRSEKTKNGGFYHEEVRLQGLRLHLRRRSGSGRMPGMSCQEQHV